MTTTFGSSTLGGSRERTTDHMFKLTLNGKPFNSRDLEKAMREAALEQLKEHVHEQLSSIRLPGTGEFPLVRVLGADLDDVCVQVEGSVELLALVRERISPEELEQYTLIETTPSSRPKVFLSFAWEDHDTARQIAETLQANGVDTWWAEWEIRAGDSLRQRIDEGLGACTHFLVLLTPTSISKPWVNQEMDAGLMQKTPSKGAIPPGTQRSSAHQPPATPARNVLTGTAGLRQGHDAARAGHPRGVTKASHRPGTGRCGPRSQHRLLARSHSHRQTVR